MLSDDVAIQTYAEFRRLWSGAPPSTPLVAFPDFVDGRPLSAGEAAIFRSMASEHVRELANFINEFIWYMRQLEIWRDIMSPLEAEDRYELAMEFVLPLAYYCVDVPYALHGRLCTSVASLSHQANSFTVEGWKDDANLRYIDAKRAAKFASGWSAWPDLSAALAKLNDRSFIDAVGDFRRLYHHGFPRSLEMGFTSFVRREVAQDGVRYEIGASPPLSVAELLDALRPQLEVARGVYDAYLVLVRQQWERVLAAQVQG